MKQTDNFKFDEANVMNELVYRNLSEDEKRQICAWKYDGEYDLYNLPSYEEMQVRQIGFMNPQREKNYYGFWDESILVGFVNILEEKEEIFIGIGVNPELQGGNYEIYANREKTAIDLCDYSIRNHICNGTSDVVWLWKRS